MLDQVGHDEEVAGVALEIDDTDFVLGPIGVLLRNELALEALFQALFNFVGEPRRRRVALWDVVFWHAVVGVGLPNFAVIPDALGDQQGVITPARDHVVPRISHLPGRFQVVAVTVEGKAVTALVQGGFVHRRTRLHTQHHFV